MRTDCIVRGILLRTVVSELGKKSMEAGIYVYICVCG